MTLSRSPMRRTKPNRCKFCHVRMPEDKAHHVIHDDCIPAYVEKLAADKKRDQEKKARAEAKVQKAQDKERLAKLQPLSWHKKQAQKAMNAWIVHVRDKDKPCISCGVRSEQPYQAGHYRTRGSSPHLALDPRNLHKQCVRCNLFLHGNQSAYRSGLVYEHGEAFVVELESDQTPRKYSADDYDAMAAFYRAKLRAPITPESLFPWRPA